MIWFWLRGPSGPQYKYGGVVEKRNYTLSAFLLRNEIVLWESYFKDTTIDFWFNILQVRVLSLPQFNLFPKVSMGVKECVILSTLFTECYIGNSNSIKYIKWIIILKSPWPLNWRGVLLYARVSLRLLNTQ